MLAPVLAAERAQQAVPAGRRVAEAETFGGFSVQAALLEIVDGLRMLRQLLAVPLSLT